MALPTTKPIPAPPDWRKLLPHPLSQLTDFGVGIDVEALAKHMQENGYDESEPIILIWVDERMRFEILDGRHRQDAAIRAEEEPTFRQFVGKDAMTYVAKKALRQHLNESQRAAFAAKLIASGLTSSQAQAGKILNVSERLVRDAVKVEQNAIPELKRAVQQGKVKVSAAATIATDDEQLQRDIAGEAEPVICARCKRIGRPVKDCPTCAEAQRKADKPKRRKRPKMGSGNSRERERLKWGWREFNIAMTTIRALVDAIEPGSSSVEKTGILRKIDEVAKDVETYERTVRKAAG